MDMVNIYGLWPDLVYCVVAVGRLYTALVVKRLKKKKSFGVVVT